MDVTICVATYGERAWQQLAETRAVPSALAQGCPVIRHHDPHGTLAGARNHALASTRTEWVIFLDADDELEPGYLEALTAGTADVRAPAVRYVRGPRLYRAGVPRVAGHRHVCAAECLPDGNWLVIGTMVRTQMLRDVGGWRDFDWSEDWDTWLRCWRAGATIEAISTAVYRAHVRMGSRNRGAAREDRLRCHQEIHRANFPELYPEAA